MKKGFKVSWLGAAATAFMAVVVGIGAARITRSLNVNGEDGTALTKLAPGTTTPIPRCAQKPSSGGTLPMVLVPAGPFEMGNKPGKVWNNDEAPAHTVNLDEFYIDATEATNAQYAAFLNEMGNQTERQATWLDAGDEDVRIHVVDGTWAADTGYENHPVVEVTWYGARAFCEWAGKRLPSEAEWEKAARGPESYTYPWGNEFDSSLVNGDDEILEDPYTIPCTPTCCDGYDGTAPVDSFPRGASPYGVLDLSGNVWEWVYDAYEDNYYNHSPDSNPIANSPAGDVTWVPRVYRGGSWNDINADSLLAYHRASDLPTVSTYNIGFRCAADSPPE
jgi:formylglycine-generating enzyme required for sulfatase activity